MVKRKVTLDDVAVGKTEKKGWSCANVIAAILVGIVLTFWGLSLNFKDNVDANDVVEEATLIESETDSINGLVENIAGVESILVALERERDTQVNSVIILTIDSSVDLIETRDVIWDIWSAYADDIYDKRLVMDLTITQGDTETIWQYTSDSTEWLQLQ